MSVIVTLRMTGDVEATEAYAAANPGVMREIIAHAVEHGLIAHRFYGTDDGKVMVVDEWPDAESFQEFFAHMQSHIGPFMEAGGMTEQPEVIFWRKLDTKDDYGWE
jgi:hypothetical protein